MNTPVIRGVAFTLLGGFIVFKLARAAQNGTISSRGFTFTLKSNPLWFTFGVACYVLLLMFCLAEVLSALGLVGDPAAAISLYFKGW
jgi:hypothetical protein